MKTDVVYYKSSENMNEVESNSVDLIVTSPPYFNIKDYSKNGFQTEQHSVLLRSDIGANKTFHGYIEALLTIWRECERVLRPNGKLCVNAPLMPMLKKELNTHYNRHIYDIQSSIQHSILNGTGLYLLDLYIWNRTNPTKRLMFGSYPFPRNFYAQNTVEFITVYVKDGVPQNNRPQYIKDNSALTQKEWIEYTRQVWNIPIPNKNDAAFGKHSAIMPEEIVNRCVRLYSYTEDIVLDPFAGSGTTLKAAKQLGRHFIGYELYENYKEVIEKKIYSAERPLWK